MVKKTPFFPRTSALNQTMLWDHWVGYAAARRYDHAVDVEYYAVRNGVAVLDSSPLFKYRFKGAEAERYLTTVLARDIRTCATGQAQYTVWCDERGFVLEDGVIMRMQDDEFWLTAARPNLRYFQDLANGFAVEISEFSTDYGILAVQGPRSIDVLQQLSNDIAPLPYFGLIETTLVGAPVVVSRTGFTGDRGYEIWIPQDKCLQVWDALMEAGAGYNIIPFGLTALSMVRIEAGLLLINADFAPSRFAWIDGERDTPIELGLGWMFRKLKDDDRDFVGRAVIEAELTNRTSRWKMVGLEIDWRAYEEVFNQAGLLAPKAYTPVETATSLYDLNANHIGYATSLVYSPLLKRHIGLGKVPLEMAKSGTEITIEIMVNHKPQYVLTRVAKTPFFEPERKTE